MKIIILLILRKSFRKQKQSIFVDAVKGVLRPKHSWAFYTPKGFCCRCNFLSYDSPDFPEILSYPRERDRKRGLEKTSFCRLLGWDLSHLTLSIYNNGYINKIYRGPVLQNSKFCCSISLSMKPHGLSEMFNVSAPHTCTWVLVFRIMFQKMGAYIQCYNPNWA